MTQGFLQIATIVCAALTLFFVIKAYITRRMVKKAVDLKQRETLWVQSQLERAIALISESADENEILIGLQILSVLDISLTRLEVLPRLTELTRNSNARIAKQAEVTIATLSRSQ